MAETSYTGADLIADFIAERCCGVAFLVTGGACAFIVDAIGRNPKTSFVCFQHEQAAAMAADESDNKAAKATAAIEFFVMKFFITYYFKLRRKYFRFLVSKIDV